MCPVCNGWITDRGFDRCWGHEKQVVLPVDQFEMLMKIFPYLTGYVNVIGTVGFWFSTSPIIIDGPVAIYRNICSQKATILIYTRDDVKNEVFLLDDICAAAKFLVWLRGETRAEGLNKEINYSSNWPMIESLAKC